MSLRAPVPENRADHSSLITYRQSHVHRSPRVGTTRRNASEIVDGPLSTARTASSVISNYFLALLRYFHAHVDAAKAGNTITV